MPTIAVCNGTARTSKYIIEIALDRGYRVKALVRSASRFYAQTKKRDDLSAHEWSNYDDLETLEDILEDVSTVYVALSMPLGQSGTLNRDCIQSVCAVLRRKLPKGAKSPTNIVLLASGGTNPTVVGDHISSVTNYLLFDQYGDLRLAQKYLEQQQSWLRWSTICPGAIVDVREATSQWTEVSLAQNEGPKGPISYARLATAMLEAGEGSSDKHNHKYLTPLPTTKVVTSLKDFESAREVLLHFFRSQILPAVFKGTLLGIACAGLGYFVGVREQGAWIAANLGVDLR